MTHSTSKLQKLEKEFKNVLSTFKQPKKVLVVTENEDVNVELSARNIPGVQVTTAQGLNVLDIITNADSLVITEAAAKKVEEVLG
ncbi:50S ribosomal protein L4 [Staphylococcus aureus]